MISQKKGQRLQCHPHSICVANCHHLFRNNEGFSQSNNANLAGSMQGAIRLDRNTLRAVGFNGFGAPRLYCRPNDAIKLAFAMFIMR